MLSLQEIAQRLGGEVTGRQVLCPGPGHSHSDRSLSVRITGPGDDFIVHSFSGDNFEICRDHVRQALGMPAFEPKKPQERAARPKMKAPVATYDYRDEAGELLFQVCRYEPKAFVQRRPNGKGDWDYSVKGVRQVLYRLADLKTFSDASPVIFVEGEKDADNVARLGMVAVTISGAVASLKNWPAELFEPLGGRDVVVLPDRDDEGETKAAKAMAALAGIAKTAKVVRLPGLPPKGDVSDYLATGKTAEELMQVIMAPPIAEAAELPFIDVSAWSLDNAPERDWGVRNIFLRGAVNLLSGEGAAGKSLLLLQLGIAHALGRDWIGHLPEAGDFLYIGAEDEAAELHRRLADILRHYGADFADIAGKVHLLSLVGETAVLGTADRVGIVTGTPLFNKLLDAATRLKPMLIGIDTAADVFAGNENDRSQAQQFVSLLRRLALASGGYVLLCSHPSLSGMNSGSGLSGSTAWHNSVRGRAYLSAVKAEGDDIADPTLRQIEFKKSNYSRTAETIALKWQNGVYRPIGGPAMLDRAASEQLVEHVFTALLDRFNEQKRNLSHKETSRNYAPTVLFKEAEAKKHALRKRDLEAAMRRLFDAGRLEVQNYGPPCKGFTRLATR
jgi:RecA-family ATPase/5S rRNA maturation endonuclease (ribonuclease M5)